MRNIESELHETLLEIASESFDLEEQALIIAEALPIYKGISAMKTAGSNSRLQESQMTDAILQALERVAEYSFDKYTYSALDSKYQSAEQIVNRASGIAPGFRLAEDSGFYGKGMDIDDEDLSIFLKPEIDGNESEKYHINDAEERHHPELYEVDGSPRHWTDSSAYGR